jgi:hypothetical protein
MERQEMINECKRIIGDWGSVNTAERELDCSPCVRSVGNGKQNVSDLIESFNKDGVEVVVYNDEIEISSYDLKYEDLDDDILAKVHEILDIYDVDMEKTEKRCQS